MDVDIDVDELDCGAGLRCFFSEGSKLKLASKIAFAFRDAIRFTFIFVLGFAFCFTFTTLLGLILTDDEDDVISDFFFLSFDDVVEDDEVSLALLDEDAGLVLVEDFSGFFTTVFFFEATIEATPFFVTFFTTFFVVPVDLV